MSLYTSASILRALLEQPGAALCRGSGPTGAFPMPRRGFRTCADLRPPPRRRRPAHEPEIRELWQSRDSESDLVAGLYYFLLAFALRIVLIMDFDDAPQALVPSLDPVREDRRGILRPRKSFSHDQRAHRACNSFAFSCVVYAFVNRPTGVLVYACVYWCRACFRRTTARAADKQSTVDCVTPPTIH